MNDTFIGNNRIKHVLIIHPEGNCFNNPSLKCIIDMLLDNGCDIDLRYKKSFASFSAVKGIKNIPYGKVFNYFKKIIVDIFYSWKMASIIVFFEKLLLYKRQYDLIIGVDRYGLIEASMLHRLYNIPYIFISFEIIFEVETSSLYKSLERKASQDVALWLVQDNVRAEQLQHENKLPQIKKYLLPLASTGLGCFKKERLRDSLGISAEKKVAIVIGSIAKWSMTRQILESVVDWPEDWVIIIHERYGRTNECLKNNSKHYGIHKKIFISNSAASMVDDMGYILAGVSVGIAFYKADFSSHYTGNNILYLGMASGKIATYLRYGVPVILNEIGVYSQEAKLYKFGYVVQKPSQIKDILVEASRDEYRNNAITYFSKKLDFNNYKDELFSLLSDIFHKNFSINTSTNISHKG